MRRWRVRLFSQVLSDLKEVAKTVKFVNEVFLNKNIFRCFKNYEAQLIEYRYIEDFLLRERFWNDLTTIEPNVHVLSHQCIVTSWKIVIK